MNYKKVWTGPTAYIIKQVISANRTRVIDEQQNDYKKWILDGNTPEEVTYAPITSTQRTFDDARLEAMQRISASKWANIERGVNINGVHIKTDQISREMIHGAVIRALVDPSMTAQWKVNDSAYIDINAQMAIAVGNALNDLVEASYDREKELLYVINHSNDMEFIDSIQWDSEV